LTRVVAEVRVWHLALAGRFVARGWLDRPAAYFLLHFDEVARAASDAANGAKLREIATRREKQLADERPLRMPLLMRESELATALRRARVTGAAGATAIAGLCVSAGCVEGEVVVIRDPRQFRQMKRGAILVAPATDPSWTPLFTLAAGVVVEVGGMLSHASTVAREFGLPALANVKDATRLLRTGDHVRLDASGGFLTVLPPTAEP
jgi:pyruvate,water dikinase